MKKTKEERFFNFVKQLSSGCWEWQGAKHKDGYGFFTIKNKCQILAHRASFLMFNGEIPKGKCVCHTCDKPACVNPNHLWIGSHSDNMRDMKRKGRAGGIAKHPLRGIYHSNAHYSIKDIKEIRQLYLNGKTTGEIAKQFQTTYKYIWKIVTRKVWKEKSMQY